MKNIRIIPMNHEKEFKDRTIDDIQQNFFLGNEMELSNGGNCRCYSDTNGLQNVEEGDLLLFQMDAQIIASAELFAIIKSNEQNYSAEYLLKKDSIKTFEPITFEELKEHCPNINRFGQGKTDLIERNIDVNWLINRINKL